MDWEGLRSALAAARKPAVMIFSNAAHYPLVHNFLCGLLAAGLESVLGHVVLWCADEASRRAAANDWEVQVVDVSRAVGGDAAEDAPFGEVAYARFAAVKAMMPWAAASLGFDSLTQDADVVWRRDVLAAVTKFPAAVMADSNRVDTRLRKCKAKDDEGTRRYHARHGVEGEDCSAFRCVSSVNGGFLWLRHGAKKAREAAIDWFAECPTILERRENQPSLVASLERRIPPGKCAYDAPGQHDLVVLDLQAFVSGQRPILALEADRRGDLVAFHCNFRFGWRAKCRTLRFVNLLFLQDPESKVCQRPPRPRCDDDDGGCTGGPCNATSIRGRRWRFSA